MERENAEELAQGVIRLKKNPDFCDQDGKSGLEFVSENYARDILALGCLDIMQKRLMPQTEPLQVE